MKVSVYCTVYNHEKYIRSALEGFVSQITNFDYEVYVHDDASTDRSADIIREYARKYPNIIKPIFQTENQYSKKVDIFEAFICPQLSGDYIACCEGDDYWTDPHKLQIQADFLDSHPEYCACVHNSYLHDLRTGKQTVMYGREDRDIGFLDVVQSGSACYQTASLMHRREYALNMPDFYCNTIKHGFGDYPLSIYLALSGKIRYLGKIMSVYRFGSASSWTASNTRDPHKNALFYLHTVQMLEEVNTYTQGEYEAVIRPIILRNEYEALYYDEHYGQLRKPPYRSLYLAQPLSHRTKTYLKQFAKPFYHIYRKYKYARL